MTTDVILTAMKLYFDVLTERTQNKFKKIEQKRN